MADSGKSSQCSFDSTDFSKSLRLNAVDLLRYGSIPVYGLVYNEFKSSSAMLGGLLVAIVVDHTGSHQSRSVSAVFVT